jgi:hypothetical protein
MKRWIGWRIWKERVVVDPSRWAMLILSREHGGLKVGERFRL